jgi:hypothetical protein
MHGCARAPQLSQTLAGFIRGKSALSDPHKMKIAFVDDLQSEVPGLGVRVDDHATSVVSIPARHQDVGSIIIDFDDGEVTVSIGEHFHSHFDPGVYRSEGYVNPDAACVRAAVTYVRDFIAGRILFHIRFVNGRYAGSGTLYLNTANLMANVPHDAKLYTWAGPWNP